MTKCQNCKSECKTILDLGNQYICNRFLKSREAFKREKKYPLVLVFCPSCTLVQLSVSLPTSLVFNKDFGYLSSSSKDVVTHYTNIANNLIEEFNLKKEGYVVDIGSNDGVSLKPLQAQGISVLGVEPVFKIARMAYRQGIETIPAEFEHALQKISMKVKGRLKVVTAFDCLAHTGSPHKFLKNMVQLLKVNPDAIFISQSQYLPYVIERGEWDTIYHEHQRFYTLTSLQNLFTKHELYIYDAMLNDFYGGSFLAYASLKQKPKSKRLMALLTKEKKYTKLKAYEQFAKKAQENSRKLRLLLLDLKSEGKTIIGLGAPMKSSTLLAYSRIDKDILDVLTEVNKLKIGMISPSGIPVVDEKKYFESNKSDYCLILSWNMQKGIIKKLKANGIKSKFIAPLPKLKVLR